MEILRHLEILVVLSLPKIGRWQRLVAIMFFTDFAGMNYVCEAKVLYGRLFCGLEGCSKKDDAALKGRVIILAF